MRGGLRSACSLAIVLAFAGCAGSSWQFWKAESGQTTSESQTASAPSAEAPVTAVPAAPVATPAAPAQPVAAAPSSNGFKELAGLGEVRFRAGQIAIVPADHKALDSVVRWLKANPSVIVLIEGHTDDLGTREDNLVVGEKRATAVMKYLISRGLEPGRVSVATVGSDRPACGDKTDTCRAKNRRARFLVKG